MSFKVALTAAVATQLLISQAAAKRNILTSNISKWSGDIPLVSTTGARKKNWKLTGQTGWSRDSKTQEMQMDLAFIVNTTDDGVDDTEKIVRDDIINICWAIPSNKHTSELVEYEAGCATIYKGAPGDDT